MSRLEAVFVWFFLALLALHPVCEPETDVSKLNIKVTELEESLNILWKVEADRQIEKIEKEIAEQWRLHLEAEDAK